MSQGLYDYFWEAKKAFLDLQEHERAERCGTNALYQRLEDFIARGLDRDLAEAVVLGMYDGADKGKVEVHHEVAQNMLKKGYAPSSISKMTGLSEAKINSLRKRK